MLYTSLGNNKISLEDERLLYTVSHWPLKNIKKGRRFPFLYGDMKAHCSSSVDKRHVVQEMLKLRK
jgi:hypothetical protein